MSGLISGNESPGTRQNEGNTRKVMPLEPPKSMERLWVGPAVENNITSGPARAMLGAALGKTSQER